MRFRRAQYVTVCQQSLVTGVVLAVAASAAGVRTLDIVPTPGSASQGVSTFAPDEASVLRQRAREGVVETAPVEPEVREFAVQADEPAAASGLRTAPAPERQPRQDPQPAPEQAAPAGEPRVAITSDPEPVTGYGTVGVTWAGQGREWEDDEILVQLRTRQDGAWSGWTEAEYHDEHGPDGAEAAAAKDRPGTDAVVVGEVERVQVRALTADGTAPDDLRLAVIDPGVGVTEEAAPEIDTAELEPAETPAQESAQTSDGTPAGTGEEPEQLTLNAATTAMAVAPRPQVFSRAQWGANERLRSGSPSYGTVQTGFIHHTVNANGYSAADVPALLRGIYAYHTQSRGWSDVGYNVLVDRFGRIWEGRYGGVNRAVVGAHTLGYNEASFAMSAIGNFDVAAPPQAMVDAYAAFFAWKLSLAGIKASTSRIVVKGKAFQAINGHRDAGSTACPGRYLYAKLPAIRTAAQRIQNGASTPAPTPTPPPAPAPTPPATFQSPTQLPQPWAAQPAGLTFPPFRNVAGSAAFPDLVLKKPDGSVSVMATTGQTNFTTMGRTAGNWRADDLVVAAGDVTGDGRGDVLARGGRGTVTRVYAGNGAGAFSATKARTSAFNGVRALAYAGDWNGDGRSDLLAVTAGQRLVVFAGNGRGGWTRLRDLGSWQGWGVPAAVGDLNGDGTGDLAARRSDGWLWTVPVTRTGTLGTAVKQRRLAGVGQVLGAAGDLSGDGIGDVVLRRSDRSSVQVVRGIGGGRLGSALGPFTAASGVRTMSLGPVSGSVHGDLVGVSGAGNRLVTVRHNGRSNIGTLLDSGLRHAGITQLLSVGDWDGDGRADLVTRQDGGDELVLRLGQGGGQFGTVVRLGGGWAPVTGLSAVGDVTGDGHPDLVGKPGKQPFVVYPGDGEQGFAAPRRLPTQLRTFHLVGSGAWATGGLRSRMTSSDGSFVPKGGRFTTSLGGYDWVVGLGDVDGDGRADVLARAGNVLWLLPGTGSGLGARRLVATGFAGYQLGG